MRLLLKLAWRNLWRNKRRSILTLSAICFATFASIAMRGVQHGTYEVNIRYAVQLFSGYLQIQNSDYNSNPSITKNIRGVADIENIIIRNPEITGYTKRIYADGLISFKDNSLGSAIFGIDPQTEKKITRLLTRISSGRFFETDSTNEVVVGVKLLENLNARIGDNVVILAQGADGSMGNLRFKIIGSIKTGSPDFDAMGVFIGLKKADELLALYGRIHAIVLGLPDIESINPMKDKLTKEINDNKIAVLSWEEIMPDFKQSIELDNVSGIFYLAILVIIVAFGILNTVLMSVTERFREFGITLSIGMPQEKLVYLIILETIFIALLGILIGNMIGYGINYYILQNPIEIGQELAWVYEEYGFLPVIESSLKPSMFINTTATIFIVSLVACFYPMYRVYNLEPLKGIRYT